MVVLKVVKGHTILQVNRCFTLKKGAAHWHAADCSVWPHHNHSILLDKIVGSSFVHSIIRSNVKGFCRKLYLSIYQYCLALYPIPKTGKKSPQVTDFTKCFLLYSEHPYCMCAMVYSEINRLSLPNRVYHNGTDHCTYKQGFACIKKL